MKHAKPSTSDPYKQSPPARTEKRVPLVQENNPSPEKTPGAEAVNKAPDKNGELEVNDLQKAP